MAAANEYVPTYGGDGGNINAYSDTPSRRPRNWHAWTAKQSNAQCVYSESSLICASISTEGEAPRISRIDASDGRVLWAVPAHVTSDVPVVVKGTVVAAVDGGLAGFALANGRSLWTRSADGTVGKPTTDGTRVYGATMPGGIVAVDAASGELRWRHDLPARGMAHLRVRVANGLVHVVTPEKTGVAEGRIVHTLSADDGKTRYTTRLSQPCDPWSLKVVPLRGREVPGRFLCDAFSEREALSGYVMQWP
ncbi:PQQ-binding-like beta-propeller repeat protein, partial [Streptomyces sp. NRRL B-24572]|uniref:outer membrane protein assembly factor BamB family protein n=1 Tax=Streptomyces sp. NRRL B-24572 TaxID=1962156 RepID=UPI0015C4EFAC